MEINAFNAAKTYGAAKKTIGGAGTAVQQDRTTTGAAPSKDAGAFSPADAAKGVVEAVVKSENTAAAFMTGKADPHSLVEAMATAELAVETAVTLRNRVVEAYQELLRMPV